jgi:HNH endonuclease
MSTGYGMFEGHLAHRVAYTIENGLIPRGKFICHHCDTPLCVRPDHLFIGTNMDNMRDAIKKGRMSPAFMRWSKDFGRRLVKRAG